VIAFTTVQFNTVFLLLLEGAQYSRPRSGVVWISPLCSPMLLPNRHPIPDRPLTISTGMYSDNGPSCRAARWHGLLCEPSITLGPLPDIFTLCYIYACDWIAGSFCLPDPRHEDIQLFLGASCHFSIHRPPLFLHVCTSLHGHL
jgi:hypothetical protein